MTPKRVGVVTGLVAWLISLEVFCQSKYQLDIADNGISIQVTPRTNNGKLFKTLSSVLFLTRKFGNIYDLLCKNSTSRGVVLI